MPVIDVLAWELVANTKGLIAGVGVATSKLKLLAAGGVGAVAGVAALGAAMVILGVKATKMAAKLDSALAKVSTLLPVTTAGLQDVRKAIIAMSTRVPQTPVQLTEALYQAISAGATDTAEALFLVETASKAAIAGQSDTETATKAITTVLNAYQLDISEATRVSDVFFATIRQGVIEFPDLAATIGNVATTAALAGVSVEELGAAMATLTKFGNNAARSSTQLNALLLSLTSATDEQKAQAQSIFGIDFSIDNLNKIGFVEFLREIEEATNGDIQALAKLFPKIRAAKGIFVLAGAGAEEFRTILQGNADAAGAAAEAYDKMANTAGPLWDLFKNKLNVALFELGEPILKNLVVPMLQFMNKLLPELTDKTSSFELQILALNEQLSKLEKFALLLKILAKGGLSIVGGDLPTDEVKELILSFGSLKDFTGVIDPQDIADVFLLPLEEQADAIEALQERIFTASAAIIRQQPEPGIFNEGGPGGIIIAREQEKLDLLQQELEVLQRALDRVNRDLLGVDDDDEPPKKFVAIIRSSTEATEAVQRVQDTLAETLRALEDDFFGLDFEGRGSPLGIDVDVVNVEIEAIKSAARELDNFIEEGANAEELTEHMANLGVTLEEIAKWRPETATELRRIGVGAEKATQKAAELADKIGDVARAAVELGESFGLLPDILGDVIGGLDLVASGTFGILDAIADSKVVDPTTGLSPGLGIAELAGPIGIALGGLSGLFGGLFGGPSPQEQAQIDSQIANTNRLRRLTTSIDDLREAMFSLPGELASDLIDALESVNASRGDADLPGSNIPRSTEIFKRVVDIINALKDAGFAPEDIERIAAGLGIEVDRILEGLSEGGLKGGDAEFLEFLEQAQSLFTGLGIEVENFFDTLAGRLELANQRIALFDIEDPIEQIAEFVKVLESSGANLSASDLERLRAGDEELIQELVHEISTRTGRFGGTPTEALGALGDFNSQDLIDLLAQIESIGDQIADGSIGADGVTTSFQTFNQISATQGSAIIAQLSTSNFFLREIMQNTAAFVSAFGSRGIQPISSPDIVESDRVFNSESNVTSDLNLGSEVEALRIGNGLPRVEF